MLVAVGLPGDGQFDKEISASGIGLLTVATSKKVKDVLSPYMCRQHNPSIYRLRTYLVDSCFRA